MADTVGAEDCDLAREGWSGHNGHEGVAVVTDTPGAELARAEERSQRTRRVTVVVRRNGHTPGAEDCYRCERCADGVDCDNVGQVLTRLKLQPGYWRSSNSSKVRVPFQYATSHFAASYSIPWGAAPLELVHSVFHTDSPLYGLSRRVS